MQLFRSRGMESAEYTDEEDCQSRKDIPRSNGSNRDSGISPSECSTPILTKPVLPSVPSGLDFIADDDNLSCSNDEYNNDDSDSEQNKVKQPEPGRRVFIPPRRPAPKPGRRGIRRPVSESGDSIGHKRSNVNEEGFQYKRRRTTPDVGNNFQRKKGCFKQNRNNQSYQQSRPNPQPQVVHNYNTIIQTSSPEVLSLFYRNQQMYRQMDGIHNFTEPRVVMDLSNLRPNYNVAPTKPKQSRQKTNMDVPSGSGNVPLPISRSPPPIPERLKHPPQDNVKDLRNTNFWPICQKSTEEKLVDDDDIQYLPNNISQVSKEAAEKKLVDDDDDIQILSDNISKVSKEMKDLRIVGEEMELPTVENLSILEKSTVDDVMDYENSPQTQMCPLPMISYEELMEIRSKEAISNDDDDCVVLEVKPVSNPQSRKRARLNNKSETQTADVIPTTNPDDEPKDEVKDIAEISVLEPVEGEEGEIDCEMTKISYEKWLTKMVQFNKKREEEAGELLELFDFGLEPMGTTSEGTSIQMESPLFFHVIEDDFQQIIEGFKQHGFDVIRQDLKEVMMQRQKLQICLHHKVAASVINLSDTIFGAFTTTTNVHQCILLWKQAVKSFGIILDDLAAAYLVYFFVKTKIINSDGVTVEKMFLMLLKWIVNHLKPCYVNLNGDYEIGEINNEMTTDFVVKDENGEDIIRITEATINALKLKAGDCLKRSKQNCVYRFHI